MVKLTSHKDIKKYVISVIKTGDKVKIQKTLKRYWEWLREKESVVETAREIFKGL